MKQSSSFNDGALLFGERKLTIVDCDFFVENDFVALVLFTVRPFYHSIVVIFSLYLRCFITAFVRR